MIKYVIVDSLVNQANKIKEVYEEIGLREINDELSQKLHTLVKEEEMIYSLIPLQDYQEYLDYFLEFQEIDPNDILSFVTLGADFNPEIRIIQKLLYNQAKVGMFTDKEEVPEDSRWQYLYNYELYNNLLMYYYYFSKEHDSYELFFNVSYALVLYHSPYAESIYLKNSTTYNREQLIKFSGLLEVVEELDEDYCTEIQMICSCLLEEPMADLENEEEEQPDFLEEPFTKLSICMYLGALYYSIEDEEMASTLVKSYKSDKLNEKQKELFDEMALLVANSFAMKRSLKKKE